MQFARRTDYSLRVLLYLALHPDRIVSIPEIADAYRISHHHLAKIAQRLAGLHWIESQRGQRGGLRLSDEGARLTIGDVVRALERFELVECFQPGGGHCPITPACGVTGALLRAQQAFMRVLDGYPLSQMAQDPSALLALLPARHRVAAGGARPSTVA